MLGSFAGGVVGATKGCAGAGAGGGCICGSFAGGVVGATKGGSGVNSGGGNSGFGWTAGTAETVFVVGLTTTGSLGLISTLGGIVVDVIFPELSMTRAVLFTLSTETTTLETGLFPVTVISPRSVAGGE